MMEALACIVIVIGLLELRGYREFKARQLLLAKISRVASKQTQLAERLTELQDIRALIAKIMAQSEADKETFARLVDACEETRTATQTILREYELNGVPMGYQRKSVDAIEGL